MQRPTLRELIERNEQDIASRLGLGTPPRVALSRVLARAQAGLAHGLYGYIDSKEKNFFPDTGDEAAVLRWANLLRVPRLSPVAATGSIQVTGTDGAVVPAGREWQSASGVVYTVDEDCTIASGVALAEVTAKSRGTAGNLLAGAQLALVQPIAGIISTAVVQSPGLGGGADLELIEALRVRVLDRLQSPPSAGAGNDYVKWAKDAHPDVTRAWVAGQEMSDNSVTVRVVTDDAPGGLIPETAVLEAVEAYIETLRPVTAEVYVAAPIAAPLNPEIAIRPNTQAVRDAVTAELTDLLKREAEPGGTILLSRIDEAISNAAGEEDHSVTSPAANVTHDPGEVAVLGTITWSAL